MLQIRNTRRVLILSMHLCVCVYVSKCPPLNSTGDLEWWPSQCSHHCCPVPAATTVTSPQQNSAPGGRIVTPYGGLCSRVSAEGCSFLASRHHLSSFHFVWLNSLTSALIQRIRITAFRPLDQCFLPFALSECHLKGCGWGTGIMPGALTRRDRLV